MPLKISLEEEGDEINKQIIELPEESKNYEFLEINEELKEEKV